MQELIMKDLNRYTAVVDSDEFLSVRNFASMSLNYGDYHCKTEKAEKLMKKREKYFSKRYLSRLGVEKPVM
ncbi:hypothetical protein [Sodalis glossinidius]|uniref:hypothetical protein n=1 Tax=Sodalis glossinidius TaxID=63612 RepID=UPI00067F9903|nr:hypothetical protein [Sodalis glossinidius]